MVKRGAGAVADRQLVLQVGQGERFELLGQHKGVLQNPNEFANGEAAVELERAGGRAEQLADAEVLQSGRQRDGVLHQLKQTGDAHVGQVAGEVDGVLQKAEQFTHRFATHQAHDQACGQGERALVAQRVEGQGVADGFVEQAVDFEREAGGAVDAGDQLEHVGAEVAHLHGGHGHARSAERDLHGLRGQLDLQLTAVVAHQFDLNIEFGRQGEGGQAVVLDAELHTHGAQAQGHVVCVLECELEGG